MKAMTLRLDRELYETARIAAEVLGISLTQFVRDSIDGVVNR